MQRAILIVLLFGLVNSIALAQPVPTGEPSIEPTYGGLGGERGYGSYGRGGREHRIDPRQTRRLVERWKASKQDAERENVQTELRNVLQREFAARLAVHEREIKELEEKVRQLRERLALRREKQDEIVEHRLQQILREAQGLGWGSEVTRGESIFHYREATGAASAAAAAADDLFGPPAETPALHETGDEEDIFGGEAPSAGPVLAPKETSAP